jgi:sigma-B regulation protein RsbU (phosphoserine phosphatase)
MPFVHDALTLVLATILLTITALLLTFSSLAGVRQTRALMLAGLFAAMYAVRMLVNTDTASYELAGAPLEYVRSALEYLVPLPATLLFAHHFGEHWRRLNQGVFVAFAALAGFGIPFELITHRPYALKAVADTIVVLMMVVFAVNLVTVRGTNLIRVGAAIFALFVLNQHLGAVPRGFEGLLEPVGFLFFAGSIVATLLRDTIASRGRLIAVESELSTARTIQLSIIPDTPPPIPGLEIAAAYQPASEVGGDFYDFVDLGDGRLAVFIADVSGHGVPAALVASMLKIALAAQPPASEPAEVLHQLNQLFCGRLKRQFFTAAYGVFANDTLSLASGGHPPPIVGMRELHADGFVIGRIRTARFTPVSVPFTAGDVAVFYTDGIIEAASPAGEIWGWERLQQCIEANRHASPRAIADTILDQVRQWTAPGTAEDDLTLIVVRNTRVGA